MAKHRLYDPTSWSIDYPRPFNRPGLSTDSTTFSSTYKTNSTKAKFHPSALRAILAYMDIDSTLADHDPTAKGAIGSQGDNYLVAEYHSSTGETHVVVYSKKNGGVKAGRFADPQSSPDTYRLKAGVTGTAIFLAIMPLALEDEEFADYYSKLADQQAKGYPDDSALTEIGCVLCDNLYRRITDPSVPSTARINVNIGSDNIPALTNLSMSNGTYNPTSVLFGTFEVMVPGPAATATVIPHNDFVGKYKFSSRALSPSEAALVPALPDWYVIPEDVVSVCEHIQKTSSGNHPMRNIIMRGPAGSGKTEGAKAIAAGLGLPYVFQTCAADSDSFSLLGQFVPAVEGHTRLASEAELPTVDDILMDPATAYAKLTGVYDEDVTVEMVYDKLLEVVQQKVREDLGQKPGFQYVDTPLVQALRHGYVAELQEPSVIANQGVLVGLNGLLDNCKSIMLPTGEVLTRHPDAVVIITTNTDYVGCRSMNQSLLSRMDLHCDVETPEVEELVKRVSGITGCADLSLLHQMAETVDAIQTHCKAGAITDGCCGTREFISWVQSYMICGDVLKAAKRTILGAVSASSENREEILSTCFDNRF